MTDTITRRALDELIIERLNTITGVTVYDDGEVPKTPPPLSSSDPRVGPYIVYWTDTGHPGFDPGNTELGDSRRDLVYTPQFTCVAGYRVACVKLLDRVHATLHGWIPPVPVAWSASPMRIPLGYTARIVREDDVTPSRFSAFPQYQTVVSV